MDNPFILTFGKEPLLTIRRDDIYQEIINDFSSKIPSNQLYMLMGARGAGKTVLLSEEYSYFNTQKDWIVADINPHRNIQEDLASQLYEKGKLKKIFLKPEFNFSFHGVTFKLDGEDPVTSISTILDKMFTYLKKKNIRVLITLDEVAPNANIKEFSHDFQSYLRKGYDVFLLMSGLYENVACLQNDKSLTFLYRAPKILLKPLDLFSIKNSYIKNLNVDEEKAEQLAKLTKGYGFGYQLVGHLYFEYQSINEDFLNKYDEKLKINSYDKIWSSVNDREREIIYCLLENDEVKTCDILEKTKLNNSNFSVHRDRLIHKGIILNPRKGFLSIALPRFKEFIKNNI